MKIVTIGGGPGGYTAAIRAAQQGHESILIEKAHLGGTCLNQGCIPSKIFRRTADVADDLKGLVALGFDAPADSQVSMPGLQKRKSTIIGGQRKGIAALLDHSGVTLIQGTAAFAAPGSLNVTTEAGTENITYDRAIIATGSRPVDIPAFPVDGEHILSSDHFLDLEALPQSALIVGGGVVGCEFAFILASFGVKVTVVEALDRVLCLPGISRETSRLVEVAMKKKKIKPLCKQMLQGVEIMDGRCRARLVDGKDPEKTRSLEVDKVIVTVGRVPVTDRLGLENIDVKTEKGFIPVDDRLATAVPDVWAIGDAAWAPGKPMLAHVASREAEVAVAAICGDTEAVVSYRAVPAGIFTAPEVAAVGMSHAEALDAGIPAKCTKSLFRTLGKVQALGKLDGHAMVTFHEETHEILGVELAGAHATDIIAQAALAVEKKLTLEDIVDTIHAHPTVAEVMMEVCMKALDRPLHG